MSSNAPHSSMRRYVIAAIAAIGCLLPAACDVAAASTGYHNDWSGQGQQGGGRNNGGSKPTGANSTGVNSTGAASTEAAESTNEQGQGQGQGEGEGQGQGQGQGEGQGQDPAATATVAPTVDASATPAGTAPPGEGNKPNNGLDVLARACSQSKLPPHDGFQKAPACVSTAFGEVAAAGNDPTLLI